VFQLSCLNYPAPAVLCWLSCHSCPALLVLFKPCPCMFWPTPLPCLVQTDMIQLTFLTNLSRLTCPDCPAPAILSRLSCQNLLFSRFFLFLWKSHNSFRFRKNFENLFEIFAKTKFRIFAKIGKDFFVTTLPTQEAKYVEGWPNTTSAWAGWSRFDIPMDRYGKVHSQLICTSSTLGSPTCH
jgi:hypothetical protein